MGYLGSSLEDYYSYQLLDEVLRQIEVNDTGDMDLFKDRIEQIEEKLNIKSKG